jgi:hypothetical protein
VVRIADLLGRSESALSLSRLKDLQQIHSQFPLGSWTMVTTSLLWVYVQVYPKVPFQVLPLLPAFDSPNMAGLSYIIALILVYLSSTPQTVSSVFHLLGSPPNSPWRPPPRTTASKMALVSIMSGTLAGFAWTFVGLESFSTSAYWSVGVMLVLTGITLASLQRRYPRVFWCITRIVYADEIVMDDMVGEWIWTPEGFVVLGVDSADDVYDDDGSATEQDDSDDEYHGIYMMASPARETDELYGRFPDVDLDNSLLQEDDDDNNIEMQPFYRFNTVRSRRRNREQNEM